MINERQKKTTQAYRDHYDRIFIKGIEDVHEVCGNLAKARADMAQAWQNYVDECGAAKGEGVAEEGEVGAGLVGVGRKSGEDCR